MGRLFEGKEAVLLMFEASVRVPVWVHATKVYRVQSADLPEEFAGQWVVELVRLGAGHSRLMLKWRCEPQGEGPLVLT